jgi:hypothetical protein
VHYFVEICRFAICELIIKICGFAYLRDLRIFGSGMSQEFADLQDLRTYKKGCLPTSAHFIVIRSNLFVMLSVPKIKYTSIVEQQVICCTFPLYFRNPKYFLHVCQSQSSESDSIRPCAVKSRFKTGLHHIRLPYLL